MFLFNIIITKLCGLNLLMALFPSNTKLELLLLILALGGLKSYETINFNRDYCIDSYVYSKNSIKTTHKISSSFRNLVLKMQYKRILLILNNTIRSF